MLYGYTVCVYLLLNVILSFGDRATEDVYDGVNSKHARRFNPSLWNLIARKLDALNAAADVHDLRSPPGNRLEKLKGNLANSWSIRVNEQYRIVFRFAAGNATEVRCEDYH